MAHRGLLKSGLRAGRSGSKHSQAFAPVRRGSAGVARSDDHDDSRGRHVVESHVQCGGCTTQRIAGPGAQRPVGQATIITLCLITHVSGRKPDTDTLVVSAFPRVGFHIGFRLS